MPVSGWSSRSVYGWRMIYYSMGGATLLVSFLWSFLTASTPAQHKQITEQERRYIESSLRSNEEVSHKLIQLYFRSLEENCLFFVEAIYCARGHSTRQPAEVSACSAHDMRVTRVVTAVYNSRIMPLTHTRKLFNSMGADS